MIDERLDKIRFIEAILEIGRDEEVIVDAEPDRSEHLHALARDAATRFLASLDRA